MFHSSLFIWSAACIALALGTKMNLDGCVSTDVPSPTGFCAVWYVPDTGEICSTSEFVAAVPTTTCTTDVPTETDVFTTEPLTTTQTLAVTTVISVLAKTSAALAVDTTCTTTEPITTKPTITAAAVVDTTCITTTPVPSFTFKPTNATVPSAFAANISTSSLKAVGTFFANFTNTTTWSTSATQTPTIPFTYDNSTAPTPHSSQTSRPVLASTGGAMKTASSWVGSGSLLAVVALLMAL